MKKLIGIGITLLNTAIALVVWNFLGLAFELDGVARDHISRGIRIAALIPLAAYIGSMLYTHVVYRKRLDANSYQPLCRRPVSLITNTAVQIAVMALLGFPTQDHGQTTSAFTAAICLVVVLGFLSLSAALFFGRPVGGKTSLPFVKHPQHQ